MSEENLNLKSQVCFPLYVFVREIINHYRPILDEMDITYPQYLVLLVLWEKQEQTVNQLGQQLSLDSGTLTPLLKRLEQKGIVVRKRCTSDERVVWVSLTEQGQQLRQKALCIPERVVESLNISLEEIAELKTIMDKLVNKIIQKQL